MNSIKDTAEEGAVPLEIANVVGVFYVLSSGVTVAMFLAFFVVVVETLKVAKEIKVRFVESQELVFDITSDSNSMNPAHEMQAYPKKNLPMNFEFYFEF